VATDLLATVQRLYVDTLQKLDVALTAICREFDTARYTKVGMRQRLVVIDYQQGEEFVRIKGGADQQGCWFGGVEKHPFIEKQQAWASIWLHRRCAHRVCAVLCLLCSYWMATCCRVSAEPRWLSVCCRWAEWGPRQQGQQSCLRTSPPRSHVPATALQCFKDAIQDSTTRVVKSLLLTQTQ
jgi:hypothetical protein